MGFYILEADSAIITAANKGFSIRGESSPVDPSGVPRQGSDLLATFDRPEGYRCMSGAGECFPIRRKVKGINGASVLKCAEVLPIWGSP